MDDAADGILLARADDPPAGRPLVVKDLLDTAGLVTTYGSAIFVEHVPARSAESVVRAEAAGWSVTAKANLHEFAYGVTSQNPHFGTVPNPAAPGRAAGGSSGGSAAAIAAGLCEASLGTDSGGSIRIPAAWCGVVGFKPTWDLVPADGCFPLAPSFDHVGPLGSSVEVCTELMQALVPGFAAARGVDLGGLRIGVAWLDGCDPLVRSCVEAVTALLPGAQPVAFPLPHREEYRLFMHEVAAVHRELYAEQPESYGANVATKIERCLAVTDGEAEHGRQARAAYRAEAEAAFAELDLLLTPTMAMVAPPADVDELAIRERAIERTYPFDSLGWPALALPCGRAEDGLPASVQLVGRPGEDELVLGAGASLASLVRGTATG